MKAPFRPLSFEAWQAEQLAGRSDALKVDCPDCYGTSVDECDCCGHETECDSCESDGKVTWGELDAGQKQRLLTRSAYVDAVIADATAWAGWLGRDAIGELVAAGFRVWSRLPDRRLCAATEHVGGAA